MANMKSMTGNADYDEVIATLCNLMLAGFAALGFWEVFASVISYLLIGGPLKASVFIYVIFDKQFGITLNQIETLGLFYLRTVLVFPLLYFALTRHVKSWGMPLDGWIWGLITYIFAFGVQAPLAGVPAFMLNAPGFTFLNLVCYSLSGFITAYIFEILQKRA
jgi:hypothetical protein